MQRSTIKTLLLILIISATSYGHHAMEFIQLESYNTAPRGTYVFHIHHDYMVDDIDQPNLDHWELTPGLSYGITDRVMIDVHSHFAKFGYSHLDMMTAPHQFYPTGPSPFMEAFALALQVRLTKAESPVQFAATFTFEEAFKRSVELIGGQRVFATTLILSKTFGEHRTFLLNFTSEIEDENLVHSWGLGMRSPLTQHSHGVNAGLEFFGDYHGNYSILPGIYFPLGMEDIVFKTGIEFSPAFGATRSNISLMYRF